MDIKQRAGEIKDYIIENAPAFAHESGIEL